jgi:hypothetical protein
MRSFLIVVLGGAVACAIIGFGLAQAARPPAVHDSRTAGNELAHLTKDLELTPEQQQAIKPLLQKQHDRIQALLEIEPLLTDHQKQLAEAIQQRMHADEERRND